jgi:hypothetical protein
VHDIEIHRVTEVEFIKIPQMIHRNQDGPSSILVEEPAGITSREILCSSLGVLTLRLKKSESKVYTGFCFGGDSVWISQFIENIAIGEGILIRGNSEVSLVAHSTDSDQRRVHEFVGDLEYFLRELTGDLGTESVATFMKEVGNFALAPVRSTWIDVVPSVYILDSVSKIQHSFSFNDHEFELGRVGTRNVCLNRLPDYPPRGFVELAPGVEIRQAELWRRRLERFMEISEYPSYIWRPLGVAKLDGGSFYVVCELPTDLCIEDIVTLVPNAYEDSGRDVEDIVYSICESVKFVHSHGGTFHGRLNPRAFIKSCCGLVWLNTAYFLSGICDSSQLLGGFDAFEMRFLPPSYVACLLSHPIRFVIQSAGLIREARKTALLEADTYQLGLTIFSLFVEMDFPFDWLSDSEFLLTWIGSCLEPASWLSSHFSSGPYTTLHIFQQLGLSVMRGDMPIDKLYNSIAKHRELRQQEVTETSLEAEARAIFHQMSTASLGLFNSF